MASCDKSTPHLCCCAFQSHMEFVVSLRQIRSCNMPSYRCFVPVFAYHERKKLEHPDASSFCWIHPWRTQLAGGVD